MNQDLRQKLDRVTDILWAGGATNPVTYIAQISYLIYLKLLGPSRKYKVILSNPPFSASFRKYPLARIQRRANCCFWE
jgi:hypothetical protein